MRWFRNWLREKLLDTEDDVRYIEAEKIVRGKTATEKLDFWRRLQSWYATPEGKAYQALMQQEYTKIHASLLRTKDPALVMPLLAQMQQQNWVISYGSYLDEKVKAWEKKSQAEQGGRKVAPVVDEEDED